MDSGLLEKKIKINPENFEKIRRPILAAMASDLRHAAHVKNNYLDEYDNIAIIQAYFDELNVRGLEWEYADLRDMFASWEATNKEILDD